MYFAKSFVFRLPAGAALCIGVALAASAVAAEPAAAGQDLGSVVVTATRTPQPVLDTAATVTTVTARQIRDNLAGNIGQLARYQPGISVPNDPTRFGRQGFNIRGIGGNRVLILLDGVPVPDAFAIGSFSNAGRDFVDPAVLKRVEIIRGPASSLYGSEALGGVVSFFTKDPGDYLALTGDDFYAGIGGGYSTADHSLMTTVTTAFGSDRDQGMAVFTRRQGHQFENQGSIHTRDASRTAPNPQHYQDNNALLKGVFNRGWGTLRITLDAHHGDTDTNVFSGLTTTDFTAMVGFPFVLQKTRLLGDDEDNRDRLSANLAFHGSPSAWFDEGRAIAYYQYADTRQNTAEGQRETLFGLPTDYLVQRRFTFTQHVSGGSLTLQKHFAGDVDQLLVYGFDLRRTRTDEMRDGARENLATGEVSKTVSPDNFPVRDFPLSTTWEAGAFVEDRIGFAAGRFLLVPGLRYDYYRLDADNDPVFARSGFGTRTRDVSDSSWSPRLGAVYKLTGRTSLFGQYAHGFRAPPYDDVNVGLVNRQFGYTVIPNPDLKPERSDAVEFGIKHFGANGSFTLSGYYNRFRDFIEPNVSLGVNPDTHLLTFQSRNIGRVTVYGLEFQGRLNLDFALPGLWLDTALAYGVGNDDAADQSLNSVNPPEAVLGLGYGAANGDWNVRLIGTFVRVKTRTDEAPEADSQFEAPGYATLDLLGSVKLADNVELTAGLFNLTDRKYWDWSSVQGRPAGDPVIDRYTRPGFNVGASLHVYW